MKLRVLVADDHPVVRSGIVAMLSREPDLVVVGEACDGEEAVRLSQDLSPDVVVMDLRMPNRDGASATEAVVSGGAQVLVLTSYDLGADIEAALGAGAVGCLTKDADRSEIVEAVRATARGERSLSGTGGPSREDYPRLSPRECEVLDGVARGLSNQEIGRELFIVEATVKTHLLHAFAKLGVGDRTRAVLVAIERGMLRVR